MAFTCLLGAVLGSAAAYANDGSAIALSELSHSSYFVNDVAFISAEPKSPATDTVGGETTDPADVQRTLDELKTQIESMKAQLEKKQNLPDTSKKFSAHAGGFLEADTVSIDQSDESFEHYGDIDNDFAVRDLWLWVRGEGYGNLDYAVMIGYNGSLSFRDVVLNAKNIPILENARVGYFKVESGLNNEQFIYDNTFIDWESCTKTFMQGRRLGVASIHYNADQSFRFFTGVFTGQNLAFGDGKHANENGDNVGLILNTRLSAAPLYTEGAGGELAEVLHLGAGLRWVDPGHDASGANRKVTLAASPLDWLGDMQQILAGTIDTDSFTVTNLEAAWQRGRFGLVSEGYIGSYRGYDNAYGVSTTTRFLLTPGAYQKYNKATGCFGGVAVPANMRFLDCENWTCLEGGGVWEIAGQWTWTDLDMLRDSPTAKFYGRMNQYTVALNWYWNPQTRWGLNWICARPISGNGGSDETASTLNTLACQVRITF